MQVNGVRQEEGFQIALHYRHGLHPVVGGNFDQLGRSGKTDTHTRAPTRSAVRTWLKKKENPGMYLLKIRDQDIIIHSSIDNF